MSKRTRRPYRVRVCYRINPGEFMVGVEDSGLAMLGAALDQGLHDFMVYAPTATEAVSAAAAMVHNGTAAGHFSKVRAENGWPA